MGFILACIFNSICHTPYQMKNKTFGSLLLLGLYYFLFASPLSAQTLSIDDYLIWKTSGFRNVLTDEKKNENAVFESSVDSIIWTHNRKREKLPVASKQDSWPDINEDGASTFNVTFNNIPGKIVFLKSNGQLKITMEFIKNNVNTMPYEFTVASVIKN